ncbi:Wdsub1 [Symbiodinium sp. CCMP2592]|nr:Wdsub1 [Symbiodinium sp. CCMP2592]
MPGHHEEVKREFIEIKEEKVKTEDMSQQPFIKSQTLAEAVEAERVDAEAVEAHSPVASSTRKRKRPGDDLGEQAIRRMSKDGVATDTIAAWFRLPVSTVVAFLAEPGSRDEDDEGALRCLVRRLLTDPDDFVCPINQDLMRQPVVAEDGFTYEREAIESALGHRERSPKTNLPMGRKVIPNVLQQASIRVFMERVVEEIFAIAHYLPAADARSLLVRAESLIRPEPCVPDCKLPTAVRGKLLKVLRLRANLPSALQGNALQELKAILLQTPMRELLDNFSAWDAEPLLSYCCDQKWSGCILPRGDEGP